MAATDETDSSDRGEPASKGFHIRIDRVEYTVNEAELSGERLRRLPRTPIPPDRDLYLVVPGHDDRKINADDIVSMRDGLRFFTAPNTINPGAAIGSGPTKRGFA